MLLSELDEKFNLEDSNLLDDLEFFMMTDDKFLEKANKFLILQSTEGKFYTFEEYKMATETLQKNNRHRPGR